MVIRIAARKVLLTLQLKHNCGYMPGGYFYRHYSKHAVMKLPPTEAYKMCESQTFSESSMMYPVIFFRTNA